MTQADIRAIYVKALAGWMAICGLALLADGALWLAGFEGDRGTRLLVGFGLEVLFRCGGIVVVVYLVTMAMHASEAVEDIRKGVDETHNHVVVLDAKVDALVPVYDPGDIDDEDLDDLYLDLDDEDDDIDLLEEDDEPFHPGRTVIRTNY